jgi:hypothetical protein
MKFVIPDHLVTAVIFFLAGILCSIIFFVCFLYKKIKPFFGIAKEFRKMKDKFPFGEGFPLFPLKI